MASLGPFLKSILGALYAKRDKQLPGPCTPI